MSSRPHTPARTDPWDRQHTTRPTREEDHAMPKPMPRPITAEFQDLNLRQSKLDEAADDAARAAAQAEKFALAHPAQDADFTACTIAYTAAVSMYRAACDLAASPDALLAAAADRAEEIADALVAHAGPAQHAAWVAAGRPPYDHTAG